MARAGDRKLSTRGFKVSLERNVQKVKYHVNVKLKVKIAQLRLFGCRDQTRDGNEPKLNTSTSYRMTKASFKQGTHGEHRSKVKVRS